MTRANKFDIIDKHLSKGAKQNRISKLFFKKDFKKILKIFKKVLTKEKQHDIINKLSLRKTSQKEKEKKQRRAL